MGRSIVPTEQCSRSVEKPSSIGQQDPPKITHTRSRHSRHRHRIAPHHAHGDDRGLTPGGCLRENRPTWDAATGQMHADGSIPTRHPHTPATHAPSLNEHKTNVLPPTRSREMPTLRHFASIARRRRRFARTRNHARNHRARSVPYFCVVLYSSATSPPSGILVMLCLFMLCSRCVPCVSCGC